MDKLISIIVPIYNVEKYLPKCIDSIINQTYKNIEILLINDGSTDNSGKICDEYALKDTRIRVSHNENGGVAVARNKGIKMSTGDYIAFVDSDDYISTEYCEKMLAAVLRNNADIAICKLHDFVEGQDVQLEEKTYSEEVYSVDQMIENNIILSGIFDCIGGKLVAAKLFANILFPEGRVYEDSSTLYKLYNASSKSVVLNQEYYFYLREREGSITAFAGSRYNLKKQKDNITFAYEKFDFLSSKYPEKKELVSAGFIRNIITILIRTYSSRNDELINSELFKQIENELVELVNNVDKNTLSVVLDNFKQFCLYLYLYNKELFAKTIIELESNK